MPAFVGLVEDLCAARLAKANSSSSDKKSRHAENMQRTQNNALGDSTPPLMSRPGVSTGGSGSARFEQQDPSAEVDTEAIGAGRRPGSGSFRPCRPH